MIIFKIFIFVFDSKFIRLWEILIVFIIVYNVFLILFRIFFEKRFYGIWILLDLIGDVILIVDIFFCFYLGYFEYGEYVEDKKKIV